MKKLLTICIVSAIFTLSAVARLGETPRQCGKRYGNPVSTNPLKGRSGYEARYERGNFEIIVRFVRSKKTTFQLYEAGYIQFNKKDHTEFDSKTVEKLLQKNCPDQILFAKMSRDMYWEEVKDIEQEDIDKEWIRVYKHHEFKRGKKVEKIGYAKARANLSEDNVLVITSHFPLPRGYDDWEERQEKKAVRESESRAVENSF